MTEGYEKATEMRIRHTMRRVSDLDKSIDFYTRLLGMRVMRRIDRPEGKHAIAFVGYGEELETAAIELTHDWSQDDFVIGDGFGHIAVSTPDLYGLCERLGKEGVEIPRPPGPLPHGGGNVIAFIKDPDGYLIELGERA